MIPSSLSLAKSDPEMPAVARVLLWCAEQETIEAPSAGVTSRVLHIPRSTAAHAISQLVAGGYLRRAA